MKLTDYGKHVIINRHGEVSHRLHGNEHREDGPAVITLGGYKYYYIHGEIHREDGPAIINAGGYKYYYIYDKFYRKKDHEIEVKRLREARNME